MKLSLAFCLVSLSAGVAAASADSASPLGEWSRGDGIARVRIEPCGQRLCAINTWIKPGVGDEKVGDRLVLDVLPAGASAFKGKAFDPKRNLTFTFHMDVGDRSMTTRGCMVAGLVCKDVNWTRASSE